MLLRMLEAVEGGLCSQEVPEMICGMLERCGERPLLAGGAGGDTLCATLYAGGCGRRAQFRGFEISIVAAISC